MCRITVYFGLVSSIKTSIHGWPWCDISAMLRPKHRSDMKNPLYTYSTVSRKLKYSPKIHPCIPHGSSSHPWPISSRFTAVVTELHGLRTYRVLLRDDDKILVEKRPHMFGWTFCFLVWYPFFKKIIILLFLTYISPNILLSPLLCCPLAPKLWAADIHMSPSGMFLYSHFRSLRVQRFFHPQMPWQPWLAKVDFTYYRYESGWWLGHPSEKYESQLGWLATQYMGK